MSSILDGYRLLLPLVSSSAGSLIKPTLSTRETLSLIIDDILSHPLQFEKILDRCVETARMHLAHRCTIHSFGSSLAGNSLSATLKRQTDLEVTLDQSSVQTPLLSGIDERSSSSRKPKIAIVGMAGRFPSAADHDKLWDLLEAGLDVHRKASHPSLSFGWFQRNS